MKSNIPKNLDEAIAYLEQRISPEDREYIKTVDMGQFHHSIGMNIRNDWGLWGGGPLRDWFNSLGIHHPDDMSHVILKATRRHILGYPYDIKEDVERFKKFWEKSDSMSGSCTMRVKKTVNKYGEDEYEYEYEK
jgi:hypothetical protein